jgi:hypothetical protein
MMRLVLFHHLYGGGLYLVRKMAELPAIPQKQKAKV